MKAFVLLLTALILYFTLTLNVFAQVTTNLNFVNHIQANLPEQDVFLVSPDDPKKVVRIEKGEATVSGNLAKSVYSSGNVTEHDPFKLGPSPLGPFAIGKNLGLTLEEWLAGTGTGTYMVAGATAQLDLNFKKLVPDGVYTVWCSRLTFPPNPQVVDRPCGAADGSENSFKADAEGNGQFKLTMNPMEESTKETVSLIALAYHSDGKTYGEKPGDFGFNSHVHIFAMLPQPQPTPAVTPQATPEVSSGVLGLSNQVWIIIGVVVVLLVLGWLWYSKKTPPSTPQTPTPEG